MFRDLANSLWKRMPVAFDAYRFELFDVTFCLLTENLLAPLAVLSQRPDCIKTDQHSGASLGTIRSI